MINISTALTVLGLVLSLWALILALRRPQYARLWFLYITPIHLLDDIAGSIESLSIRYKNKKVEKSLVLVRGYFVNLGNRDISTEMVFSPLCIKLRDGKKWLEASGGRDPSHSNQVTVKDPQTVEIDLGLLRCEQYFKFQGLVEVCEGYRWPGSWKIEHGIVDTSDVVVRVLPGKNDREIAPLIGGFIGLLFVGILCFGAIKGASNGIAWVLAIGISMVFVMLGIGLLFGLNQFRFARKLSKILPQQDQF